jgi:hypothetical protein
VLYAVRPRTDDRSIPRDAISDVSGIGDGWVIGSLRGSYYTLGPS